jgi:hypothetical protein
MKASYAAAPYFPKDNLMKLVRHKRRRLLLSYSMWPVYIAGLFNILPYIVPYFDDWVPHWVVVLVLVLSPLGACIHQESLHADQ